MKSFLGLVRAASSYVFDVRVVYAIVGLLLSICAHELVHVLMHIDSIDTVHLFPDFETVLAMDVGVAAGNSIDTEEVLAYAVTALVQFVVVLDVFAIHDSRNKKTTTQILSGGDSTFSEIDNALLMQLISK